MTYGIKVGYRHVNVPHEEDGWTPGWIDRKGVFRPFSVFVSRSEQTATLENGDGVGLVMKLMMAMTQVDPRIEIHDHPILL